MERSISITAARKEIYNIANDVNTNHRPITITNKTNGNNMVVISEDDWLAIEETIHLNSIPRMAESILAAKNEPLEDCIPESDVEW